MPSITNWSVGKNLLLFPCAHCSMNASGTQVKFLVVGFKRRLLRLAERFRRKTVRLYVVLAGR
jgi:hypothetical protein